MIVLLDVKFAMEIKHQTAQSAELMIRDIYIYSQPTEKDVRLIVQLARFGFRVLISMFAHIVIKIAKLVIFLLPIALLVIQILQKVSNAFYSTIHAT